MPVETQAVVSDPTSLEQDRGGRGRAMVVREYLVENFGFDDSQLKILGMGKRMDTNSNVSWGSGADSHIPNRDRNAA